MRTHTQTRTTYARCKQPKKSLYNASARLPYAPGLHAYATHTQSSASSQGRVWSWLNPNRTTTTVCILSKAFLPSRRHDWALVVVSIVSGVSSERMSLYNICLSVHKLAASSTHRHHHTTDIRSQTLLRCALYTICNFARKSTARRMREKASEKQIEGMHLKIKSERTSAQFCVNRMSAESFRLI